MTTTDALTKVAPLINMGLVSGAIALLGTLTALVVKYRLEMRKLTISENSGLRKEFLEEMHILREEVKILRSEATNLRNENSLLRDEVRNLHGIIDGMRRQSNGEAISVGRAMIEALPQERVSDAIREAGARAEEAMGRIQDRRQS